MIRVARAVHIVSKPWKFLMSRRCAEAAMLICSVVLMPAAVSAQTACNNGRFLKNGLVSVGGDGKSLAGLNPGYFGQTANNSSNMFRLRSQKGLGTSFRLLSMSNGGRSLSVSDDGCSAFVVIAGAETYAWGKNDEGQLGTGDTVSRSEPTRVLSTGISYVVGGSRHTLALTTSSILLAWGANDRGQLGNGTAGASRPTPGAVPALTNVTRIAVGTNHSLALVDGAVKAWGSNTYGQLGDGTTTDRLTPISVPGMTGVRAIAANANTSYAVKNDGSLWAWGHGAAGETGEGVLPVTTPGAPASRVTPVRVALPAPVYSLAANGAKAVLVATYSTNDYRVYGWGEGLQVNPNGCTTGCLPTQIPVPTEVTEVAIYGTSAGFAGQPGGQYYSWGSNASPPGILGHGAADTYNNGNNISAPKLMLQSQGTARSDFSGDYRSDIVLRNLVSGDLYVWDMDGGTISRSMPIGSFPVDLKPVGIADANGDGIADLYWRNSATGANEVWEMSWREYFSFGTLAPGYKWRLPAVGDVNWTIESVADLDGDGWPDLIWRNKSAGQWAIWLLGYRIVKATAVYGGVPGNWELRGAADFNGDGKADLIWRDANTGAVGIYRMDGTAVIGVNFLAGGLQEWDIAVVQDIDMDGYADIMFQQVNDGSLAMVKLNAAGTAIASTSFLNSAGGTWRLEVIGDYNGDSFPDFLWRNAAGDMAIWELSGLAGNPTTSFRASFLPNPGSAWQVVKPR